MATIYGSKLSMALFASLIMVSLFLIHHKVSCQHQHLSPELMNGRDFLDMDTEALLKFTGQVESDYINWNTSRDVCSNWMGVTCDVTKSFVTWIQLPNMIQRGRIPNNTIGNLKYLTILSLQGNNLSGTIPADLSTLENLITFDLRSNNFTGELPEINVRKINPNNFNVSNNNLSGEIPESMSLFLKSSFENNFGLCGSPLDRCPNGTKRRSKPSTPPPISSPGNKPENNIPKAARIGIAFGSPLLALFFLSYYRKGTHLMPLAIQKSSSSNDNLVEGGRPKPDRRNKFEDGMICSFGLDDLLWASTEADLGEGKIGSSYKALMIKGSEEVDVVVKKLIDVVVTKEKFESRMIKLGKMKNQNVVPLRTFHFCEAEKLLVYEYFPDGSVHDLLHGSRGSVQTPVDWNQRMGIALNAARGLAYLHSNKIVHGNFKSSNILLRKETIREAVVSDCNFKSSNILFQAVVSDYGLNKLFAKSRYPKVTLESDVYSFGVFLLELLTRKVPNQVLSGEEGIDLPRWVIESYAQEEWKTKVFDTQLMGNQYIEEKMVQLLEIAMACASLVPDHRPPMDEVVRMIYQTY